MSTLTKRKLVWLYQFRTGRQERSITRNKEEHFIMIKESIQQENTPQFYAPNNSFKICKIKNYICHRAAKPVRHNY